MNLMHTVRYRKSKISAINSQLVYNVRRHVNTFVEKFMANKGLYTWFIAGGFVSYISGRTLQYGDIDVYILTEQPLQYIQFDALKIHID